MENVETFLNEHMWAVYVLLFLWTVFCFYGAYKKIRQRGIDGAKHAEERRQRWENRP